MGVRAPGGERGGTGEPDERRNDLREARPGAGPRGMSRLERAEWFFTFLVFFAGFFYVTREARTDLQWYFRVVSIFVGVAGWMVVQVLKRRRR